MILHRFFEESIAQSSFLVGCPASGEAVVIDPTLDAEQYIERAVHEQLRIVGVMETHIHADFVSGSPALARATGATLYVSGEGGPEWQYAFASDPGVRLLRDGDVVPVGRGRIEVRHTPGHTPEHLTLLLIDREASPEPAAAFTGDFVFAGDVGRPDLLERAAGQTGTMTAGARQLFRSLAGTASWPDGLLLYPGHGAGSACGKSLGGMPVTTIGYERRANWAFQAASEDAFVEDVLGDQPEPPAYFALMKRVNKVGHAALGTAPPRLAAEAVLRLSDAVLLLDVRPAELSGRSLVPGAIAIPADRNLARWAGSTIAIDRRIVLIAADADMAAAAWRALALIGFDRVEAWTGPDFVEAHRTAGRLTGIETVPQSALVDALKHGARLVDVRGEAEYREGAIPGARNAPLGRVAEMMSGEDRHRPLVVHCQTGARAQVAATLLKRLGFRDVRNLEGGYAEWARQQDMADAY